jgi:hypothetical protein
MAMTVGVGCMTFDTRMVNSKLDKVNMAVASLITDPMAYLIWVICKE